MGGTLSFLFDTPVYFHDLGLLDMDEPDSRLQVTYFDDVVEFFNFNRFGDNSLQRVLLGKPNVKKLELVFQKGTGAITEITYCGECVAQAGYDERHDCIVAGNTINKVSEIIEIDDFEAENDIDALSGWVNGRIEKAYPELFTKFLGLYTAEISPPHKVFNVPRDAETIIFQIDLYEIDIRDSDNNVTIFVDGDRIAFGLFSQSQHEGRTQLGLKWKSSASDFPGIQNQTNRKHHMIIEVPLASQLYLDGELRITLRSGSKVHTVGWDNIRVEARHGCSRFQATTLNVPHMPSSENIIAATDIPTIHPQSFPSPNLLNDNIHTVYPSYIIMPTKIPTIRPTPTIA
jgi:hypothetical protein